MECREFQKSIGSYFSQEMSDSDLNDFLNHAEKCKSCKEELELEYIVKKGPEIIDSPNGNYNIPECFAEQLENDSDYISFRKKFLTFRYIIDTFAFWAVVFSILKVVGIMLK